MNTPWYKQFWPWFLIALPGSVVVAGISTFILLSQNQVSLVAEDYYKEGKGINQDLSRLRKADELSVSASLFANEDTAIFTLNKGLLSQYPTLSITFQHRTLADKDITQMVNADAHGRYRLSLIDPLTGPWYVEVNAFDSSWALNSKINFPISEPILLHGQNKE